MKIGITIVAASLALASTASFAGRCPQEMKAIDAAMSKAKLSEAQAAEVRKLRAEGEKLHSAGKHRESEAALDKAKKVLGI